VRAHHVPIAVTGVAAADATDAFDVDLAPPGEAITPGQTGVLYAGERVVGSGLLASS
jgi:tRNA U34 2-thiouridine synthase MnmA/TrmU